jgi:conjugal transfer mating pair stabilization protein TraN
MRQDRCWIYEQLYQCPSEGQRLEKIKSPPLSAFCLTGDCHSTDYQANGEMLDAMARLSALKEIQKDMRDDHNNLNVFKGAMGQCTRHCLSFKDCCGRLKGWGVSLGLSDCDAEDRALSEKRAQHLCHPVGTYCAEWIKVPPFIKKCVRKKSSFCCFGNRFGRLLQVQGRSQLGLGWGEVESPDCRGLSIEELSKLDLSKMDFSELFEDILKKYQAPKGPVLEQKTHEALQERFKKMQQGLEGQTPKTGKLNVNQDAL